MSATKIEWTDESWNPVTGCTPVSRGCDHCYARRMAKRLVGRFGYPAEEPFRVASHPERLLEPLGWKKPRMVFVCSMGDLFHEDVPWEFIDRLVDIAAMCPRHTFQILTKRPERMAEYLRGLSDGSAFDRLLKLPCYGTFHGYFLGYRTGTPLPNLWFGVSIEDQPTADERIPQLLQCPAAVRFVSYEPALAPVDLGDYLPIWEYCYDDPETEEVCRRDTPSGAAGEYIEAIPDGPHLDWVIAGGESGPGARPAHPDWFRAVRDQCVEAHVPFFFKQWGEHIPYEETGQPPFIESQHGHHLDGHALPPDLDMLNSSGCWRCEQYEPGGEAMLYRRVGKKKAGRLLDGRVWDEMP